MVANYFGWNPPFVGGAQKVFSRQEDERLIKNDLMQLLLTAPGERVHRPDFGTRLRIALFEPLDAITIEDLANEVKSAIDRFEPRLVNVQVFLIPEADNQLLKVTVIGTYVFNPAQKLTLETSLKMAGGFEE